MKTTHIISIIGSMAFVALNSAQAADVRVQVGDIKDSRTTGHFSGLDIELKFLGDDLDGAKGLRCTVTKALDDTGRNLIKEKQDHEQRDFSSIERNAQISLELKNPSRRALTVTEISGEIEIFKPDNDPTSVVTFENITTSAKGDLLNPIFIDNQIEMTVIVNDLYEKEKAKEKEIKTTSQKTENKPAVEQAGEEIGKAFAGMFGGMMGGGKNSISIHLKDPNSKLIKVEFIAPSGDRIDPRSTMSMPEQRTYDFTEALPKDVKLRIFIATSKSVLKTPLSLKDIALP